MNSPHRKFGNWHLWSDTQGQREIQIDDQPPRKPPAGHTLEQSGDGTWLTLYHGSEPVKVWTRTPHPIRRRKEHP